MKTGTVKYFYKTRNFGFIKKDEENDIFFIGDDVINGVELQKGDRVSFKEKKEGKKIKAIDIRKI